MQFGEKRIKSQVVSMVMAKAAQKEERKSREV
jgi:hypothetical protein